MKKSITFTICILLLFLFSCMTKRIVKQGQYNFHQYFLGYKDENKLPLPVTMNNNIWFKDSIVIYEVKIINVATLNTASGSFRKEKYETYKYSFLDLRNKKCQDYYCFSDTATPICSYKLDSNESVGWNFYHEDNARNIPGKLISISDANLNGKPVKLIKYEKELNGIVSQYSYYLKNNKVEDIFFLNKTIDKTIPKYKTFRYDLKADSNDSLIWVTESNIVKTHLSFDEDKVFEKWKKNAQQSKLPVISYAEAKKLSYPKPMILTEDSIQYRINEN